MPRSTRLLRLITAIMTLALVALVMLVAGERPAAKAIAGGILVFGAAQWLFLGILARKFVPPANPDES